MFNADGRATERRRSPRVTLGDGSIGIVAADSVRVLDLSAGGVLLVSARPATVGTRGRLSFTLAGNPLAAEVEIRHVTESRERDGYRIGAMFVETSAALSAAIERFARQ